MGTHIFERIGLVRLACCAVLAFITVAANASVGLAEIANETDGGLVTVFYPSDGESKPVARGAFVLDVALDGAVQEGNGRLIVISHGSPASPWVYTDLAQTLVESGFVVAFPEHYADNYKNDSEPGPPSWKRRPLEVSRAIGVVASDDRFRSLLPLDKVGMYGMSAGGHTALTLAGGRWSPGQLRRHCEANIEQDFQACVGPSMRLSGGVFDGLKTSIARWVVGSRLTDSTWYTYADSRIAAIVAGVPFAADFDGDSLVSPRVPLGIITARQDKWLNPQFHSEAVLRFCLSCERLVDLQAAGHGALLSPLPANPGGSLTDLISDPPGFDRVLVVPQVNRTIAEFFVRHLLSVEQRR